MARQIARTSVTRPAKGNATSGAPGPTPAPLRKYVNPVLTERVETPGYGQAKNLGPSSIEPGTTLTSPLADELRRVAALSDAGDLLGDIAAHGTSRDSTVADLGAPQTRDVSQEGYPAAHGMRNPNANPVTIPDKLGAPSTAPVRNPN
jgi:hypothetical protein